MWEKLKAPQTAVLPYVRKALPRSMGAHSCGGHCSWDADLAPKILFLHWNSRISMKGTVSASAHSWKPRIGDWNSCIHCFWLKTCSLCSRSPVNKSFSNPPTESCLLAWRPKTLLVEYLECKAFSSWKIVWYFSRDFSTLHVLYKNGKLYKNSYSVIN